MAVARASAVLYSGDVGALFGWLERVELGLAPKAFGQPVTQETIGGFVMTIVVAVAGTLIFRG